MNYDTKHLKKIGFKKGNVIAKKNKGKVKRKTALKNLVLDAINANRAAGIKSIEDFDELAFNKILEGLIHCGYRDAATIAIKVMEYRIPKKKEHDVGENLQKILVVHRPEQEIIKK